MLGFFFFVTFMFINFFLCQNKVVGNMVFIVIYFMLISNINLSFI